MSPMLERCVKAILFEIETNRTPNVGLARWTAESLARAVLTALREPDEAMVKAGADIAESGHSHPGDAESIFCGMIDKALADG